MPRDITVEVDLPYPQAEVWRALTDPVALAEWLMPVRDFAPVVGTRFTFTSKPMPGWDGIVHCEVTEVDEPHRLAYTWQGSRMRAVTTVRWRLSPSDSRGTRLRLDHTGFTGLGGFVLSLMHRAGWRRMLRDRITALLSQSTT
jgi:uncharacterized protein YndB with AHSA1/START domain